MNRIAAALALWLVVGMATEARCDRSVDLVFEVPSENDALFIDDNSTTSSGLRRTMTTPPLGAGQYQYTIRVVHNGVSLSRVLSFTGDQASVTMTFAAADFALAGVIATARAARAVFTPMDRERLPQARQELRQAMAALDPLVARSSAERFWRDRLSWGVLTTAAEANAPDVAQLDTAYRRLIFDHPGMEFAQVERLRTAVRNLKDAAYFASRDDTRAVFERTVDEIIALLPTFERLERAKDRVTLGKKVGWLERARQAPALVAVLRERYKKQNSIAQFNISVVQSYATRDVRQTNSGTYPIQGTPTRTTSLVTGQTYLRFIPNESIAEAEVGMNGTMTSRSNASGGRAGVTVRVSGTAENQVHVRRRITVTGMNASDITQHPPVATVIPVTSTTQISSSARPVIPILPRRLQVFRNVRENAGYQTALSRVPGGQAEGRVIAANQLTAAAEEPVETPPEVTNVSQQFSAAIREFIQLPQQRTGVAPQHHWLSTDERWLYFRHVRGTADELASFSPAPAFRTADLQLGIRMHESEFMNTANQQLSGYVLTDVSLQGFARSVLNYVPVPLRVGTHAPSWSAPLILDHPTQVDFLDNDRVELQITFAGLVVAAHNGTAERRFDVPFVVEAVYRVRRGQEGPMLERIEPARIAPVEGAAVLPAGLTQFFLPKVQALFREELYFDGFTPVRGGIFEPLTKINIRELRTENNWLLLGGNLTGNLLDIIRATPSGLGGDSRVIPATPREDR